MENQNLNSVYSDFANVSCNLYNFSLYFGSVEDNNTQVYGKIKMSPETAKQFAQILTKNIEVYEKTYGKINEYTSEVAKKEKELNRKIQKTQKNNSKSKNENKIKEE